MNAEQTWQAALGQLQLEMPRATFDTWVRDAELLTCEDGAYVIGVQNAYARDWLENRLQSQIQRVLGSLAGRTVEVRFVVWQGEPAAAPALTPPPGTGPLGAGHSLLNPRYTFESFVVGPSNRLAHAAAQAVAENPARAYNPLFVYGGVGLGKTHLLHAVGNACAARGLQVLYVTSEEFTNDLINAIRNHTTAAFRERYRGIGVLLIDDIQFIAGKESTQEEFFHTFNHLHTNGKQVVLSSDRPPKAMVTLEERLQSRFEWGLMTDIQSPDAEMRAAILHSKAEESGVYVPQSVIELIAQHFRSNIRELEGALNRVIAYAQLTSQPIDMKLVNMALADQIRKPTRLTVTQVVEAVAQHYRLSLDKLSSRSRSRVVSYPRQVAMYLARTETDSSFPQIAAHLGNRDHTTILHGYEKIAGLIETDEKVRREVLQIKAVLYDGVLA